MCIGLVLPGSLCHVDYFGSRTISGKLHLCTRPLDLRLVVQAAIETVHGSAEAKNIQIVSQLSSEVDCLRQQCGEATGDRG
jgi:hypothetical protein